MKRPRKRLRPTILTHILVGNLALGLLVLMLHVEVPSWATTAYLVSAILLFLLYSWGVLDLILMHLLRRFEESRGFSKSNLFWKVEVTRPKNSNSEKRPNKPPEGTPDSAPQL